MQQTPEGNRLQIGVVGRTNVGKSTLVNSLTNQELAIVSQQAGTTTDPVYKSMELLPLGPVTIIDTPGIDDCGRLGESRIAKTKEVLRRLDLVILVIDSQLGVTDYELELLAEIERKELAVVGVVNQREQAANLNCEELEEELGINKLLTINAQAADEVERLKESIISVAPEQFTELNIIGDLVTPQDIILLVVPLDLAAPKGRLILPQVQTLRDILDNKCQAMVVPEDQVGDALANLKQQPKIIVTDSQVFATVERQLPSKIMLTGFSILFARYKGDLEIFIEGIKELKNLEPGAQILIAESCTHHRTAEDIGRVKIPRWLSQLVDGELEFETVSGREFPTDLRKYDFIVHCGGCMTNRREILARLRRAVQAEVPIINYGILIAYLHGILNRALEPFQVTDEFPNKNLLN